LHKVSDTSGKSVEDSANWCKYSHFFSKLGSMKKISLYYFFNCFSSLVFAMVLISPLHSIVDNGGGGGYVDLDWKTPCW